MMKQIYISPLAYALIVCANYTEDRQPKKSETEPYDENDRMKEPRNIQQHQDQNDKPDT